MAHSKGQCISRPSKRNGILKSSRREGKSPTRILIANSHAIFREGLRALLETERSFRVVGEAIDGESVLKFAHKFTPEVLLLDWMIPHAGATEVLRQLSASGLAVRTLVLAAEIAARDTVQALNLGARGVVFKSSPSAALFEAIRRVTAGEYWVPPDSIAGIVDRLLHSEPRTTSQNTNFGLTARELEITLEVVAGYSNPEIGEKLYISEQTVKHHLTHIFDKLGVYSRVELALFAVNHRLGGIAESSSN